MSVGTARRSGTMTQPAATGLAFAPVAIGDMAGTQLRPRPEQICGGEVHLVSAKLRASVPFA